jgi:hypothetical protein
MELKHKTFGSVSNDQSDQPEQAEQKSMPQDDLEALIELGCIKEKVTIGQLTFVLRSLNATERLDLAKMLGDSPTSETLFEFNTKLLALAIQSVNGKPLEMFYPAEHAQGADVITLRCNIISSMQAPVINRLLECHTELTERCDAQFDAEQVKN